MCYDKLCLVAPLFLIVEIPVPSRGTEIALSQQLPQRMDRKKRTAVVFIADTVMSNAEPQYLTDVYRSLVRSIEFARVPLVINSVPDNEAGVSFLQQFIGADFLMLPHRMMTPLKKARIMSQWAGKIDADVVLWH